jgi:hypothetical protein
MCGVNIDGRKDPESYQPTFLHSPLHEGRGDSYRRWRMAKGTQGIPPYELFLYDIVSID